MTEAQSRLLDLVAAARYLSLKPSTLRTWASKGRIPKVKLGDRLLFDRADLDNLIERSRLPERVRTDPTQNSKD